MKKAISICRIACLFAILWSPANAALLTFEFSGTVTQVPIDDVFGDIAAGDSIQGSYTFDSSATDLAPANPATGIYTWNAPLATMTVTVGTHQFGTSGALTIGVLNSSVDQYTVLGLNGAGDVTLELFLQDNTGSAFTNDQLPVTAPSLAGFAQRDFHLLAIIGGAEIQLDGQLIRLAAQSVPEPSPEGLVFAGAIVLALARRRRACGSIN